MVLKRRLRLPSGGFPMCDKILVAVDFDNTLIAAGSDTYLARLAPGKKLPDDITKPYLPGPWTAVMRGVFRYLYKCRVRPNDVLECIGEIPLNGGMREWLQALNASSRFEVIIISNANTVFVEHILFAQGVRHLVHEVFSNYAQFDTNGCLGIHEFHQNSWCNLCPVNLCKGKIVADYITRRKAQGVNLNGVVYIGDGSSAFCQSSKCRRTDLVLVREGFELDRKIKEHPVCAKINRWRDGFDILQKMGEHFPQEVMDRQMDSPEPTSSSSKAEDSDDYELAFSPNLSF